MGDITITRRHMLGSMGAAAGAIACTAAGEAPQPRFLHGVASGDPLTDRVILWTRITPAASTGDPVKLTWDIATDDSFSTIVSSGETQTDQDRDYCVKVDATGLTPGRRYSFRFRSKQTTSPIGHTRTLPRQDVEKLRFAIVSCANYPQGYFNVYKDVAAQKDIAAVLHLGDYFYEYQDGTYADPRALELGRHVKPLGELISLDDYRTRHALYKTDPDLQAVHAAHPMIAIWDDHEIANDTWKGGAENHDPDQGEGDFFVRRDAAIKAWREWMPVRDPVDGDPLISYRSYDFGGLADLILLDTRLIGRDEQISYGRDLVYRSAPFNFTDPENPVMISDPEQVSALPEQAVKMIPLPFDMTGEDPKPITDYAAIKEIDPKNMPAGFAFLPDADAFRQHVLGNPERSMLGKTQENWLADQLQAAKAPWQILGQQLLMGKLVAPDLMDVADFTKPAAISEQQAQQFTGLAKMGLPLNLDAWDGYPAARERLFDEIRKNKSNAIVLAGDSIIAGLSIWPMRRAIPLRWNWRPRLYHRPALRNICRSRSRSWKTGF